MVRMMRACGLGAVLAVLLGGCGQGGPSGSNAPAGGGGAGQPASDRGVPAWILAEAPGDALPVAEVKADAKEGDRVVIRGRIGGRRDPISEGSPTMIIMDGSIPSCADNPGDNCPTPWDYCCEPAEVKTANTATVQVVDAGGQPVGQTIQSAGLSPLDEVIIVGVVGPRPDASVLTVMATGVYRVR